jgi:uncharacterized protein YciI
MHFLLIYDVATDYLQRRAAYRAAHLAHARAAVDRGELLLGGAAGDPPDSAVLLFQTDDDGPARRFAECDPYVLEGVVTGWTVKPWTTVVGAAASHRLP